jgi:hypothetical protein
MQNHFVKKWETLLYTTQNNKNRKEYNFFA